MMRQKGIFQMTTIHAALITCVVMNVTRLAIGEDQLAPFVFLRDQGTSSDLRSLVSSDDGLIYSQVAGPNPSAASNKQQNKEDVVVKQIEIRNPKLRKGPIPAERVPLGQAGDYKPAVAKLANGELLISAFRPDPTVKGQKKHEDPILLRSSDGGRSWSSAQVLKNLPGREPYVSVLSDGTLLMTAHVHTWELINEDGVCHSYIHRSTDDGQTWTTTKMLPDRPTTYFLNARNVLELHDGSLLTAISGCHRGQDFVWRSRDKGKTWSTASTSIMGVPDTYDMPVLAETIFWQARSGKIYAIARVDSRHMPLRSEQLGQGQPYKDHYERMVLFESTDVGKTWQLAGDFGHYGEMYPSILRLQDGRLLLTFTMRSAVRPQIPPLGVQALVGQELPDGLRFDFAHDRIMLDTKTPAGMSSGGGFGPTVQLDDGTLVTSYSYPTADGEFHLEVVRWRLE